MIATGIEVGIPVSMSLHAGACLLHNQTYLFSYIDPHGKWFE